MMYLFWLLFLFWFGLVVVVMQHNVPFHYVVFSRNWSTGPVVSLLGLHAGLLLETWLMSNHQLHLLAISM